MAGSVSPDMAPVTEFGIRFYSYNMANNLDLGLRETLVGPGNGDFLSALGGVLKDGTSLDIVSMVLPETTLDETQARSLCLAGVTEFKEVSCTCISSKEESAKLASWRGAGMIEEMAGNYNGDLKAILAFGGDRLAARPGRIFGLLRDHTVARVSLPNPKKAFVGQTVTAGGLCMTFVGAHFPITKLSAALATEEPPSEQLEEAKRIYAGTLRNVLRKAGKCYLTGSKCILFMQGDLNSRTVLVDGVARDVLLDVLADDDLQQAIAYELPVPPGRWYEVSHYEKAHNLPVTYKFRPKNADQEKSFIVSEDQMLRIGNVLEEAERNTEKSGGSFTGQATEYKRVLCKAGVDFRSDWNIEFKEEGFKTFRFPACADRVIYWAPDSLASRLSWRIPKGGYEVDHGQYGSDHKPVWLEAVLCISPGDDDDELDAAEAQALINGEGPPVFDAALSMCSTSTPPNWIQRVARNAPGGEWHWTPEDDASHCEICNVDFKFWRRRHHCRLCGRCVCSKCSPSSCARPIGEVENVARHCTQCAVLPVAGR